MVKTSAGAVTLAAGITTMLVPVAGAAVTIGTTDIALVGLAATFTASAAGAGLLGTSMKLVASAVTTISGGARNCHADNGGKRWNCKYSNRWAEDEAVAGRTDDRICIHTVGANGGSRGKSYDGCGHDCSSNIGNGRRDAD